MEMITVGNVKSSIEDNSFLYQQPWFYNNNLSLRCELGIGNGAVYNENAINRALKIFNILFKDDIIDCVFLDEYTNEDDLIDINEFFTFDNTLDLDITYNDNELYEDVSSIKRHFVYDVDKSKIKKIIKHQILNGSNIYHFVSFKNNFIFSIYDDRGCDIVFFDGGKYKEFYHILEKYFLDYDRELMKNRFNNI